MCRYAQNSRSGSGSGSSGNKSWRVCETFAPHVPEEFLKRLASTNTTATAVGNRGAINATADYIQLSRRSVSVLRIPGTACRILEACLTAIASVVLLVRWGWRYSHHWLGGFTDRKGGGWMLNRRENRTQEREDCTTCVAIDDFADGCITPHGDRRQNSTSKAFYRKSVRLGTRSCGGGLRHVLLFAVIAGIGPAAEGDGHGQSVLTVPLTPAGFQYTVGVTVSGENYDYNATAALIVDTALHLIGFPVCEDTHKTTGDGLECIPRKAASSENISTYSCQQMSKIDRDDGEIILQYNLSGSDPQDLVFLENQGVELVNASSTTTRRPVGSVFIISGKDIEGGDRTLLGWNSTGGVFGLAPYSQSCEPEVLPSDVETILEDLTDDPDSLMLALNLNNNTSESTLEIGGHTARLGDLLWGERHTAEKPSSWGFPAFDLSICGRGLMDNVTSSWPAIISTGSACLGLPQEMYDSLVAWLPSCNDGPLKLCGTSVDDLPWLSFRLSEHGRPLYIPMGSLVLEEGSLDERLCVTKGGSIYGDNGFKMPSMQSTITLGTLPLRSLYAVLDSESYRVGLAQKPYAGELLPREGNETCRAATSCRGMQTFKESTNSCEDPLCSAYYFTWLDKDTMTCRLSSNLILVAWSVALVFGLTEILGHFLSVYYGGKGVALRGQRHHYGWEFYTGRVIDACISKATRAVGLSSRRHHD